MCCFAVVRMAPGAAGKAAGGAGGGGTRSSTTGSVGPAADRAGGFGAGSAGTGDVSTASGVLPLQGSSVPCVSKWAISTGLPVLVGCG